jgi:hypothetical protein
MDNLREYVEMAEVEAGPSRQRPSTPRTHAIDPVNLESLEKLKQKANLSPITGSGGGDRRRPKSINGQPLALSDTDTQS